MSYYVIYYFVVISQKKDGWTLLHLAAESGHQDCVQLLIDEGADVSVITNEGQTPVLLAARRYFKETYAIINRTDRDIILLPFNISLF